METPTMNSEEYFNILKSHKQTMTEAGLEEFYLNCLMMLEKLKVTNQIEAMQKVIFLIETVEKEKQALNCNINQYILKEHIDKYIEEIADDDVSIIELSRYERIVPDEIIHKVEQCKDIFDNFYVLFTDYSSEHKRKIENERKNTDPILFGTFEDDKNVNDRMYFIGDWVDEYCDLTLSKFLTEYQQKTTMSEIDILHTVNQAPQTIQELKEKINRLTFDSNIGKYVDLTQPSPPNAKKNNKETKHKSIWTIIKDIFNIK